MRNLQEDLSKVTCISKSFFNSMSNSAVKCIGHCVYESMLRKNTFTSIDIGIGKLYISTENNEVRYKFIPSKYLEDMIEWTLRNNSSPVITQVENNIEERILNVYKELL